jgi:hypothetical protein
LLDERTLKDRPGIKACVIGPPQTPSVVISIFGKQSFAKGE